MSVIQTVSTDITTLEVDAIVNAANPRLAGGGGVDGAIHRAGGPSIADQCRQWVAEHGTLTTGEVMATGAGRMPSSFVIHTVGPIWPEHTPEQADALLADCYRNSLALARELECASIAFPNISTGIYGFPKPRAAEVATVTVKRAVAAGDWTGTVVFACFDRENVGLYEELLAD